MEEEQQKLYDAQVLHLKQVVAENDDQEFNKNRFQVLAELTKLRQICCDSSLCFENYKGGTAKIESCIQLKKELADQIIGGEAGQLTTMSREDFLALLEG